MNDNSQGATELEATQPAGPGEHVVPVGDHGEILRMTRGSLAGQNASVVWPVTPGDDSFLNEYRNYGRQAAAITCELESEENRISADANLSDAGKEAAIRAAKETALNRTSLIGEKADQFSDKVRAQVSEPLPATKPYDAARPWEWAQDFELVRMLRDMPAGERGAVLAGLRNGSSHHRIADALLRVPQELSGIPSAQLAEIKRGAQQRLNPEPFARRYSIERSQAALAAVMRTAVARISSGRVTLTSSARRALLGDRAKFIGE